MKRFLRDLVKYRRYMLYSAKAQLKNEVAGSFLNWLWWILDPLLFMLVYTFVYSIVFGRSQDYLCAFIFLGYCSWEFFNRSVKQSVKLVKKYMNLSTVIIGIEDNKPQAIAKLQAAVADIEGASVKALKAQYPQGGEKVLIYECTGKIVPEGKLPSDVGCVVMNVSSIAFVAKYMRTGMPLITKRLTVDGDAIAEPKNVEVAIGTSFSDVIDFCGGFKTEPKKIIMGGPMMGFAVPTINYPVLKNNNAILAFSAAKTAEAEKPETPCIRCARCVNACPFSLMPAAIEKAYKAGNVDALKALKVNLCMECGCCAYVCPAKRNLVSVNRLAKKMIVERSK